MDPRRRDFVRALALGAPAALAAPPALRGAEPKKAEHEKAVAPALSEADARMAVVLARFGPQLDEEARKAVRAEVEAIVSRAEALRKFPLDNGDSPFPVFRPYRDPLG